MMLIISVLFLLRRTSACSPSKRQALTAKYFAILETVANKFQLLVSDRIPTIFEVLRDHRENARIATVEILNEAGYTAKALNVDIAVARIEGRQKNRSNSPAKYLGTFWR
nr:unnamed protein product [Callosobruchus chinensis]